MWLIALLKDLNIKQKEAVPLYCDNQSSLHLTKNPVHHERTKHIEVDCHYIRDKFIEGVIDARYVRSKEQPADMFTKALSISDMKEHMSKMSIRNIYAHLEGECQNSKKKIKES